MKTLSHILWHAINKHEKKYIIMEKLKKKTHEYYLANFSPLTVP
jgi:hypothetical protein